MRALTLTPSRCIEWFVVANLAFLGVDILIAHGENAFRERIEWAPVAFSMVAPVFLMPGMFRMRRPATTRAIDLTVGALSIVVGVLGMVFHLSSAFFVDRTLRSLVYSAPFIAPLSYVGVGLLLLLVRMEPADSRILGPWILFLALSGFVGNLILSLLDHAQNGFFRPTEWVPVVAAAYACSFLSVALVRGERFMLHVCLGVCAVEAIVGVVGFVLHLIAHGSRPAASFLARIVFGAPIFAPLLFTNLALLASIGIWAMLRAGGLSSAAVAVRTGARADGAHDAT